MSETEYVSTNPVLQTDLNVVQSNPNKVRMDRQWLYHIVYFQYRRQIYFWYGYILYFNNLNKFGFHKDILNLSVKD